ncbi:MAG TPA: hypothetical protein VN970_09885 [Thermoanaerobaculia bacterium]|nr:hypothetical protein [Thermoanaerobaculia bacterium]
MDPRRRRFWKIAAVVGLGLLGLVLIALRLLPAPGPVLEVVPGWYVLKRLPTLTNRAPAWPMQLRISIGGTVIPVPNLKRQVLLVGDRGDVSRVAQNGEAMRALQAWATGPEEKNVIEAFDQPPRSVPTRRLRAGEHFSIEFVHGSITERLCSDTVRPRSGVQTISLNQRSLSAASALR